jgi:hypothetical protein
MPGNQHPWRIMTAVFGGVLLLSFFLVEATAPAGNIVLRKLDQRFVELQGTLSAATPNGPFLFHDGRDTYTLDVAIPYRRYLGQRVRIVGILHESSGTLEVQRITSFLDHSASAK